MTCTIDSFSTGGWSSESEEKRVDATSDKYSLDQYTEKTWPLNLLFLVDIPVLSIFLAVEAAVEEKWLSWIDESEVELEVVEADIIAKDK